MRTNQSQWLLAVATVLGIASLSSGCSVMADGHNRQGVRDARQGNYQTAMQRFQKAVARDPKSADAYYNMAATLHRLGVEHQHQAYLTQAEELYNQSLDLDEKQVDAYRGLAVLLAETQRSDKAFKLVRNWVSAQPGNAEAHIELARLHEEFGQSTAAVQSLQNALRQDYQNRRAFTALAQLREKQGDTRQALENYRQAYALGAQPEVASRIASLSQSLGLNAGGAADTGTRTVDAGAAGVGGNVAARPPRY